jgi:hypothetical protein
MQDGILYDTQLGAKHTVHPCGKHLAVALSAGTTWQRLRSISEEQHITPGQLHDLLGALNTLGALQRTRTFTQLLRARGTEAHHLLYGIRYAPLTWRSTASAHTLATAVCRATWPLGAITIGVCCLAIGSGLATGGTVVSLASLGLSLSWLSLFVHEIAHVQLIKLRIQSPIILQRGLRIGIVHAPLGRPLEVTTALTGPACGIACCWLASLPYTLTGHRATAWLCIGVGLFHLGSLLPSYGDGATLITAITKRADHA